MRKFGDQVAKVQTWPRQSYLTLSLPRVSYIKIQDESQISFCKILKYKWYHVEVMLTRFHLIGHTIGFHS